MAGTREGALKAQIKIIQKFGVDENGKSIAHQRAGSKGGKAPHSKPQGFAANPELARISGMRSGKLGKRDHKYLYTKNGFNYYTNKLSGETVKFEVK